MKKENSIWQYIVLMAEVLSIFFAVNFIAGFIIVTVCGEASGNLILALGLADFLVLLFVPYVISRCLQRRSDAVRAEWIAGISHDIRTPLALVLGSADKIISGAKTTKDINARGETNANVSTNADAVIENAEIIKVQTLRIKELVVNLNTENRLSYGKRNVDTIVLGNLIRDVFSSMLNASDDEKYEAVCNIDTSLEKVCIRADESLVIRMLENLIGNSLRHNPDGCRIEVGLSGSKKKNECVLTIFDDGKGTDTLTLDMLNSKEIPVTSSEHGMGLRVVKKIVRSYRWKIYFSSAQCQGFIVKILIKSSKCPTENHK